MAGAPIPSPNGGGNPNGGHAPITATPRARELFLQGGGFAHYERAKQAGTNLTAWLEAQDPSRAYQDGLDAYERQLMVAGIRTAGDGHTYYADEMGAWERDDQTKALFPEWARRQWQQAPRGAGRGTRAPDYNVADQPAGSVSRPFIDDQVMRYTQLQPAVPLEEVIATTTMIAGNAYRSTRFQDVTAQKRLSRVAEGAPLPRRKLTTSDNSLRFGKFGMAIENTYEQVRFIRIDLMALHINLMRIQNEVDELAAVIDVIANGDGNSGTAATVVNLTTLDSNATVNNLTAKAWLAFKQKFLPPYILTTALMQPAIELQLRLLNMGTANVHMVTIAQQSALGGLVTINDRLAEGVRVAPTADAPANQIMGIDARFAIERVVQIGSEISEMARWIENQTMLTTFSLSEAFGRFQLGPTAIILNLAA